MDIEERVRPALQGSLEKTLSLPSESKAAADGPGERFSYIRLDRSAIVNLTRRMATLIGAGIPIGRVLDTLVQQEENRLVKGALQRCSARVHGGWYLSKALGLYPRLFSPIYLSMVKMGENIGDMPGMLNKLASFLERDLRMEKKAQAAMVYPAFILGFALLLVGGLFRFVLPPLLETCVQMSGPKGHLPLPTMALMAIIRWMKDPYVIVPTIGGVLIAMFWLRYALETRRGREIRDRLLLILPVIGDLNHKLLMARFCRSLGILVGAGVPIISCFDVIVGSISNTVFNKTALLPILEGIKAGAPMAEVVEATGMFPPMVSSMISVGESTGNLAGMLTRTSVFYDEQVEHALETFLQLIEPVMVCAMGLLVCFIMVAVFAPLYAVVMSV